MKIFVCLKQVPDSETKIKLLPDQSGIDGAGIKWVMNPYDEHAVEESIKFREKNPGAQVWAISLGPKSRAVESLRTALAMGADEAIIINSTENLDAYLTAKALAHVIATEGPAHLVFTGKLSIDANQSSVPQMIAEFLSIPHTSVVSKFEYTPESSSVERDTEGGAKEIVQMINPALVAANKGLNMPRYASLPGIMKAKKKVIKEIEFSSLGITATEQKVRYFGYLLPPEKPAAKLLAGDASSQVAQLISCLRDEAKVI
ncbi:MAG: electron transfer flavoprotein subunit beta/FixA family protein [Bdellovibrionota bacterium]